MGLQNFNLFYLHFDLQFSTRSYSSFIYRMMRFKGSNKKVCKMMTSYFRTLLLSLSQKIERFAKKSNNNNNHRPYAVYTF